MYVFGMNYYWWMLWVRSFWYVVSDEYWLWGIVNDCLCEYFMRLCCLIGNDDYDVWFWDVSESDVIINFECSWFYCLSELFLRWVEEGYLYYRGLWYGVGYGDYVGCVLFYLRWS